MSQNDEWTKELQRANDERTEELRDMIRDERIAVVIGSGVSKATNPEAPMWNELVESGISRCEAMGMPAKLCAHLRGGLGLELPEPLLAAAEAVRKKLSENGGGELTAWLRSHFEKLEPVDDRRHVIEALSPRGTVPHEKCRSNFQLVPYSELDLRNGWERVRIWRQSRRGYDSS